MTSIQNLFIVNKFTGLLIHNAIDERNDYDARHIQSPRIDAGRRQNRGYDPHKELGEIAHVASLEETLKLAEDIVAGEVRERVVVDPNA